MSFLMEGFSMHVESSQLHQLKYYCVNLLHFEPWLTSLVTFYILIIIQNVMTH